MSHRYDAEAILARVNQGAEDGADATPELTLSALIALVHAVLAIREQAEDES
jgi:hypothetical protein